MPSIVTVLWTNSCIFYKYFSMRKLILLNANVFLIYFYFYCALFFFTTSPWIILSIMDMMLLIIRFSDFMWFMTIKNVGQFLRFCELVIYSNIWEKKIHTFKLILEMSNTSFLSSYKLCQEYVKFLW